MSPNAKAIKVRVSDGATVDLQRMGGSGPDLLICHATGFHGRAYAPLASCLSDHFQVWVMDYRGHGSSQKSPMGDYSWSAMTLDVVACATAIDSQQLFGFGHSMGGATLLTAEAEHPGTLAGLFVYEPIVLPPEWFAHPERNRLAGSARKRREVFESRAKALERYASRPPLNIMRADTLAAYVQEGFIDLPDGRVSLACTAETEALTYEGGVDITLERVAGVKTPTIVAAGSEVGDLNLTEVASVVAQKLSRGRFLLCEHLSHFGPLEAPKIMAAHVIQELLK